MVRESLLEKMAQLDARNIGCAACVGTCCTFEKNSMRVTPREARDITRHLAATGRATDATRALLRATIARFGLDRAEPGDGRRSFGRRRYTCPFFVERRCTIAPEAKPYGCLAFNARAPGVRDGENCASDQNSLSALGVDSEATQDLPRAVLAALTEGT